MIQEVLRLYPPADIIPKESPKGGMTLCGFHIPEGTTIVVRQSVYIRHV